MTDADLAAITEHLDGIDFDALEPLTVTERDVVRRALAPSIDTGDDNVTARFTRRAS